MKNVLFVASECTPFIKTGGLADVIGSLPQALKQNEKIDARVILPLYDEIDEAWKNQMEYHMSFDVQVGWRSQEASIYTLKYNRIMYYFIANTYYFTRKGIYGYYDDGERFVFFSQAVIEALAHLDFKPEILHAHDWQAGMAVALANIKQPIENMKTIFTIHNIKYQGIMPLETFDDFFQFSREHIGGMEWNGMLNCLKSGLFHADKITTVSPTYAEEIKDPYYSEGLHPILEEKSNDLIGILNGIDMKEYNPLTDPQVPIRYRSSRARKKENKVLLQEKLGLPKDGDIPMFTIITRLVEQKGLHLVQHILDEFMEAEVQFVVLGTGDPEFEAYFADAAHRYPDKLVTLLTFDEGLARQLYASADFFVMPSKFEPCGLAQLISLQYKTVPIVRETGGLKDTVQSYNEFTSEGNGFSFQSYNAHDLLSVLHLALATYHHPENWAKLMKNVNKSQFSWKESAGEYAKLYGQIKAEALV
ncbi:starch synthase [Virgibacillus profundi]|uniref:Glycogen synthase n=1 Tax=Virgibacillus profundi TaxID=2024555 RepID=A0A2A2IGY2_9BACI|nr:glycogen synthase GlgA [Virgibacillus profundi]PAV30792.1 starch synthase [Virgibacillus profundi]PXY54975.1 glycogen synthase GlgA [Virgibacillus profundi]